MVEFNYEGNCHITMNCQYGTDDFIIVNQIESYWLNPIGSDLIHKNESQDKLFTKSYDLFLLFVLEIFSMRTDLS